MKKQTNKSLFMMTAIMALCTILSSCEKEQIILPPSDSETNITINVGGYEDSLFCSETELNFAAYEGAANTLTIRTNSDWKIKSIPDWLRPSAPGGIGCKTVTLTTLSANKASIERSGEIVIGGTEYEDVRVQVKQYGEAMPNCIVTPKHVTVLSNGIAFDMDYSRADNVAYYFRGYMEADEYGRMSNPQIITKLQREFQRHIPSENEVADFSGLRPNTEYIIYTLAYDMESRQGELMSTRIRTRKEELNEPCGKISDIDCTGTYWLWNITMSHTCHSYWMMTTENYAVANASDVLQAWWLEDAVRCRETTEYVNGGGWRQVCKGNMLAVWTRGEDSRGNLSGIIDYRSSSSTTTRSNGWQKNNAGDHSGQKLTTDQYKLYRVK